MKVNSLLMKTALAAAVASVSFGATAGVLQIPNPSILATEVFGDAKNNANESDLTAITLPRVNFYADAGGDLVTKTAGSHLATVKLTLLGAALFAENYQDPNTWAAQGITVSVNGTAVTPADVASVDAGTGNDNTITITLQNSGPLGDQPLNAVPGAANPAVSIQGLKVKRLKNQLQTPGVAEVTVEVRAVNDAAGAALPAEAFENTPATVAFVSTPGVVLAANATSYAAGNRGYIEVADAQQSFTDPSVPGHRDLFDADLAIGYIDFGTLAISRGKVAADRPGANQEAGKETGTKFDFTGADKLTLSVTGDAALAAYGLELRTNACSNAGTPGGLVAAGVVTAAAPNTATFNVNTADVNLDATTNWNLCGAATVTGTERIPQLSSLNANFKVEYGNVRYGESTGSADYGSVVRNGCQVTLFNLPNVNAQDKAMIRLTNTSDKDGQVNAFVWTEDGQQLDIDAELTSSLVAHGTELFHTNPNLANGVYLGDVLPQFAAEEGGRGRIVLQGAFPSCEALGLVRSPNGTLTNMTSTTNSSGFTAGTSNTSN